MEKKQESKKKKEEQIEISDSIFSTVRRINGTLKVYFTSIGVLHHFVVFILELLPNLKYRMPFKTCPIPT